MMGYGDMMWGGGVGFFGSVYAIVFLVDLILVGIYLWKKIKGK